MASAATHVFLSYKAEDRSRLKPLVAALEAEEFDVWWDRHIGGGTDWRQEIQQHLDAARCVIVAWSEHSVGHEGHFVRDEATRAKRRGSYLPIRLDDVEPPLGFGEVQAIDLVGWKGKRTDPRFVALVEAVKAHVTDDAPVARPIPVAHSKVSRRTALAGGVGVLAVAGVGGWAFLKPGAAAASNRIAVMSFSNMSGDPAQAYFSEGIAEELRGALSRVGMQVIGKASCDAVKDLAIPAAAAKLGVANILTGSVRRSPETIRVTAQLVNGQDGVEKWAQNYDRAPGDTIKIQSDIATQVAGALRIALGQAGRAALALGGTADAGAQDLYLRAVELFQNVRTAEAIRAAVQYLDAAISRDPDYANAYRLKARALVELASSFPQSPGDQQSKLAQGQAAATRAVSLAPRLGSAYATLALLELRRLDFAKASQYNGHALALSPEDPAVLSPASYFAQVFGHAQEALQLAEQVIALDPLDPISHSRRASVLFTMRRYREAIDASREALQVAPHFMVEHRRIGDCLTLMNKFAQARAEYQRAPADDPQRLIGEAMLAARSGYLAAADQTISRIHQLFGAARPFDCARIYAQSGQRDKAFAELDLAVEAKDPWLAGLKTDPFLDPIRNDPRYAALLRRLNFP